MVAPILLAKMTTAITTMSKNAVKLAGAATVMEMFNSALDKIQQIMGMPFMTGLDYLISMISSNTTESTMKLFEKIMEYLDSPGGKDFITILSSVVNVLIGNAIIIVDLFSKVSNFFATIQISMPSFQKWVDFMEKIL